MFFLPKYKYEKGELVKAHGYTGRVVKRSRPIMKKFKPQYTIEVRGSNTTIQGTIVSSMHLDFNENQLEKIVKPEAQEKQGK
jgi:hypothetical protein